MSIYSKITNRKLTEDLDSERNNFYPSIIRDPEGRLIVFYQKNLKSGKQSNSFVSVDGAFGLSVEAGNGEILGESVSWGAATVTADPEKFSLLFVDKQGNVQVKSTPKMGTVQDAIILAYVRAGSTQITRYEEIEKVGKYIFCRYQKKDGDQWVWDEEEYMISVGEKPRAFYDKANDKIILSYNRDSIGYLRVFDLQDELTFEYLSNTSLENDVVNLKNDPQNTARFMFASGFRSKAVTGSDIDVYDFRYYMLGYAISIEDNGIISQYLHLPYMEELNYPSLSITDIYLEVYSKSGDTYTLESEVPIALEDNNYLGSKENWVAWGGPYGKKFLKIRFKHAYRTKRIPESTYHEEYFLQGQDLFYQKDDDHLEDACADYMKGLKFGTSKGLAGINTSFESLKESNYEPTSMVLRTRPAGINISTFEESKKILDQYPFMGIRISKSKISVTI